MSDDVVFARVVTARLDHFDAAMAVFKDPVSGALVNVPRVEIPSDARPGATARVKTGVRPRVVEWLEDAEEDLDALRELLGSPAEGEG